ncbi:MAG: low molecular weight protein-tyrosine-phosphatase [Bacteroidales bacterium]
MKIKVLFVCLGNICRSPSAEGVMRDFVKEAGLDKSIFCDSAGTAAYHVGEKADARMRKHAFNRGYNLTSISRKVKSPDDFYNFDYIIGMDDENISDLENICPDAQCLKKIHRMVDFCEEDKYTKVPDPYYGGAEGFEFVIDILEDACKGLLNSIREKYNL